MKYGLRLEFNFNDVDSKTYINFFTTRVSKKINNGEKGIAFIEGTIIVILLIWVFMMYNLSKNRNERENTMFYQICQNFINTNPEFGMSVNEKFRLEIIENLKDDIHQNLDSETIAGIIKEASQVLEQEREQKEENPLKLMFLK